MTDHNSFEDDLLDRIMILSEGVWENRIRRPDIEAWLRNFNGDVFSPQRERILAIVLLAHFTYFGDRELRVMLRSLYRDLFRYPLIQSIRTEQGGTTDPTVVNRAFQSARARTRFLGMGNPSESGAHLLYYFRQENRLPKSLFVHQHEVLRAAPRHKVPSIDIPNLDRLIFIDDVLGSGQQALEYSEKILTNYREAAEHEGRRLSIHYYVLFAKQAGLDVARNGLFDEVNAVHILDESESAFSPTSRLLANLTNDISIDDLKTFARHYGEKVLAGHGLGYRNGQMLLGFHHNIPDNTLPIFWMDELGPHWQALFPRYQKV